jgi:hypothetical protein
MVFTSHRTNVIDYTFGGCFDIKENGYGKRDSKSNSTQIPAGGPALVK